MFRGIGALAYAGFRSASHNLKVGVSNPPMKTELTTEHTEFLTEMAECGAPRRYLLSSVFSPLCSLCSQWCT